MAFLAVQWGIIAPMGETPYRAIFTRLVRFRHIVRFSPTSIIHIIQHNSFHVKYCHIVKLLTSPTFRPAVLPLFYEKNIPQHQTRKHSQLPTSTHQLATSYQLVKVLTSSCSPPHTPTTRTHTTRAGKDSHSIRIIIIIMISIR